MSAPTARVGAAAEGRLPLASLLALAMAAFITILTEALPAGLLPQMAQSLAVSEAWVGQTVTIYAIGSLMAAIPLTAATQGLRRRPLLLAALAGFVLANTVTTLSTSYALVAVLAFVLAHNVLYTYIAPFLSAAGMAQRTDAVLLVFGVASLLGIWVVGVLIDRRLRAMTLGSIGVFAMAALALGVARDVPGVVYVAVAAWGVAFGGSATLFQTALAKVAGSAADVAQSMLVTAWNLAIAGGAIVGGVLLERVGAGAFAPALVALLALALGVVWAARRHGFPAPAR